MMKKIIRYLVVAILFILIGCAYQLSEAFKEATAKLTTPQPINVYQRTHFSYATTPEGYGCGGVDISSDT